MTDATDMSTPVTRGELKQELERFEQELKQELATKQELEMWGGALLAHIKDAEKRLGAGLRDAEKRLGAGLRDAEKRLGAELRDAEKRLGAELARHADAIKESMLTPLSAVDEKYKDLPGRVSQLESKVFARRRR